MTELPEGLNGGANEDLFDQVSMDPAQQSLAEALRITFRLLQFVMVLLVVLFLGSGFQTVGESERGVKLVFGRVVQDDVPPGVTWNWPFPIGELVKVPTGQQSLEVDRAFAPELAGRDRTKSLLAVLPRMFKLDPSTTGSVITADGAVAHTWWRVVWRRQAPAENVRNLLGEDESSVVAASVKRAVVRAVAEITIEQLLKQGSNTIVAAAPEPAQAEPKSDTQLEQGEEPGEPPAGAAPSAPPSAPAAVAANRGLGETSLELRVRSMAQQMLDGLSAGIVIDQVILAEKSPPGVVLEAFSAVNNAETQAGREREEAEKKAREILNGAAGEAYPLVLGLIDSYERGLELGDKADVDATLAEIERALDGEPLSLEGRPVRASGQVTSIVAEARQYRTDVEASAETLAKEFEAKLPAFRASPAYFVASEWGGAYRRFLGRTGAERFFLPSGSQPPELWLNRDPEIRNRSEREASEERSSTSLNTLTERRRHEFERERKRVRDEREAQRRQQQQQGRRP